MSIEKVIHFEPENGWLFFCNSTTILKAIWQDLYDENGEWKYVNPTATISIWENQLDASYLVIEFYPNSDEKISQLYATQGQASNDLTQCLKPFNLRIRDEKTIYSQPGD